MITVNLDGKVAVVTGASSGIGFEAAYALAQAGAHVYVVGRREEERWMLRRYAGASSLFMRSGCVVGSNPLHHRKRLVVAKSITSSPRPFITARKR